MFDILMTEEQKKVRDEVRSFVRDDIPPELLIKMDAKEIDYPDEFIEKASKKNLLGLHFPKKYGGRGLDWVSEMIACEEVGVLGAGLGCSYVMPIIVGEALNKFGTEEQKQKYLTTILKGEKKSGEGLTEPRGGSDFYGTISTAIKKSDRFILNGEKRFVAGGQGSDFFLIYAKTDLKAKPHESLTAFIVERDDGVEVEEQYEVMGFRGMGAARIVMKNVEIPEDRIIGELNGARHIFNTMMVPERLTSGAGAVGTARAAMEVAIRYADKREAFGTKIRRFQGISFKVCDSMTGLDAARGLLYRAAKMADMINEGAKIPHTVLRKVVSQAKLVATEAGYQAVYNAMQIIGGIAYTDVYPIERLFRDARLSTIWTGSTEVMKMIIQNEIFREVLAEPKNLKRNIELDTPGAHKTEEKVYKGDISKYLPD
ncbi:MAG: acyl-CoA/acyl-ACP dehydrogenase [Candidatus Helarchaeota archaeon]|nr:acyl-CoA/acyl-ACP dehydrogenase [Candidatus Helarchaeota archaeon]